MPPTATWRCISPRSFTTPPAPVTTSPTPWLPGLDTVAVPDFDIDRLGHGYFAQAEALLHDIYDLMRHGQPPAKRQRILAMSHEGTSFWKVRR